MGLFKAVRGNVFCGALVELFGAERDDKVLVCTFLATEVSVLTAVLAAVVEVERIRSGLMLFGWITAGTSPVLVLTRGPRLILKLTVLTEPDLMAFELTLNLLFDFVKAVDVLFDEALTEDCIPVFGCFLRWLSADKLDFEVTLYELVNTRF